MAEDFYLQAAQRRAAELEAERQAALADLAACRAAGDTETATTSIQKLADLEAERQNLTQLYNQYVQSQQPPQQPELSAEERAARPWDKMTWQDGLDLARTSRYARDLQADDPNVVAGFRATAARRARGE